MLTEPIEQRYAAFEKTHLSVGMVLMLYVRVHNARF